ncbi:hypothetical protein BVRB_6g142670 [Beta vulgaris subsp. vulgaris]|uniref:Uncharacterized protein n=1 Tax=Beta vulgaris subsp. vulgaris TaxID=3555 RepID=A0A0J8C885_BETVV|nr:hypothetical protein BVRB_6g142670 [Beta vulgaris subsp. vulgaris]
MAESYEKLQQARKEASAPVGLGDGGGYGNTWVQKITNNGNHVVHFVNPYHGTTTGDIQPGETDDKDAVQGYIPYWGESQKYEFHYKNETLDKQIVVAIKDLGEWLLSFAQDGIEHITDIAYLRPASYFPIEIIVKYNGFEIYDIDNNERKGGLFFW